MHAIIATEIWGRTSHVEAMAARLGPLADGIIIVDPYDGQDPGFTSEEQAYACFKEVCGHSRFAEQVGRTLFEQNGPVVLLGFSAGAGAVWAAVTQEKAENAKGAICFYGSSIRNMLELQPKVPVDLIFPEHEPHFDVRATIDALGKKPLATCHTSPHGHGFMNPLSPSYDARAYETWMDWIEKRLAAL